MSQSNESQSETMEWVITDPDQDRYSRLRLIRWWNQEKLRAAKVLVVGAGALGNEVLKNLALLGLGTIYVVDFDKIEISNLSRAVLFRQKDKGTSKAQIAAKRIKEINPNVQVKAFNCNVVWEIGLGLFRRMDAVIGCLDNREARLAINRFCQRVEIPWIDGGLDEFVGLVRVFLPSRGPCYECTLSEADYEFLNVRYACPQLDPNSIIAGAIPTTPTIASIIGAMQVQELLKLLHGHDGTGLLTGRGLLYNGLLNSFELINYQRVEGCQSHESYREIVELPKASAGLSVGQLLLEIEAQLGINEPYIELRHEIVLELECICCGLNDSIVQPLHRIPVEHFRCPKCGEQLIPDLSHYVSNAEPFAGQRLLDLGVPLGDVLIVRDGKTGEPIFIELSDDMDTLLIDAVI